MIGKKRKFIPFEEIQQESKVDKESISAIESKEEEVMPVFRPVVALKSGFNQNILYEYVRRPSLYPHAILYNDENCVIIKDAYPKALIHLLLIPKESFLIKHSVREFVPSDLPKLQILHKTAKQFVHSIKRHLHEEKEAVSEKEIEGERLFQPFLQDITEINKRQSIGDFLYGYHVIPSLHPIHLHIITSDFTSSYLKTKKHWNSFTTDYFLPSDRVEELLSQNIEIRSVYSEANAENRLKEKMICHVCNCSISTIPELKRHLLTHFTTK